jgi:hypothetical protein
VRRLAIQLFDAVDGAWESARMRRAVSALLVLVFGAAVLAIDLNRHGLLPAAIAGTVPTSHFRAIELAFWCLLGFEVVGLVLGLAHSVSTAAGKQFEIFSLILLRHSFEEFGHLGEPIHWEHSRGVVLHMLANGFGALLVMVVLGFYYAAQHHRPISGDAKDTRNFIAAKKMVSLALLAIFAVEGALAATGHRQGFFESFYTVIVFADVLVVLLSLRYSASYHVVFRNSGLAVATVLLRLALSAPAYYNAALGLAAAVFALGLTVACNRFAPTARASASEERPPEAALRAG